MGLMDALWRNRAKRDGTFWQMPMSAGPSDFKVGEDDAGRPVYRTPLGVTYVPGVGREARPNNQGWFLPKLLRGEGGISDRPSADPRGVAAAVVGAALDGITAPRRAAQGQPVTYGDVAATALDWGAMTPFGRAPAGSIGIFAGRRAKTANIDALNRAEDLARAGASRDDIWRDTGWFRGADGQWRFEIDDSGAGYRHDIRGRAQSGQLQNAFQHDALFDAYDFRGVETYPSQSGFRAGTGSYSPPSFWEMDGPHFRTGDVKQAGRLEARGSNLNELNSVALHELQHGVQFQEGFALGGNLSQEAAHLAAKRDREMMAAVEAQLSPREMADLNRFRELKARYQNAGTIPGNIVIEVEDLKKRLRRVDDLMDELRAFRARGKGGALEGGAIDRAEAYNQYRRLAGEVESRNVERRANWNAEARREIPPWETQDVPDADQILRFVSDKWAGFGLRK